MNRIQNVREFLDQGGCVDDPFNGEKPLTLAAALGHAQIVDLLLQAGAQINTRDASGQTALHRAADPSIVTLLLSAGAEVDVGKAEGRPTPLHRAAGDGDDAIARLLLQHGADVNARGGNDTTPLILAAEEAHVKVIKTLLQAGAEVDAQGGYGLTPLMEAVRGRGERRVQAVKVLVEAGADLRVRANGQATAMHWACQEGSHEIVEALIEAGADVNAVDFLNMTPLAIAVEYDRADLIAPLISRGADPNIRVSTKHADAAFRGKTSRELAVALGRREIVGILDLCCAGPPNSASRG